MAEYEVLVSDEDFPKVAEILKVLAMKKTIPGYVTIFTDRFQRRSLTQNGISFKIVERNDV